MKLTELVVSMTLTVGSAGAMSVALDIPGRVATATGVSEQVTCRTVDTAIAAYAAEHGTAPVRIVEVQPYLTGDTSGYRISNGVAAGPGCPDAPLRR